MDFRYIDDSDFNTFVFSAIEEKAKSLSPEARFYVTRILSDFGEPESTVTQAFERYAEIPLATMYVDARDSEGIARFHLHKRLGDFCLLMGGLFDETQVDDDMIVHYGVSGYHGASSYYPWKGHFSVFPEMGAKFPQALKALRGFKEELPVPDDLGILRLLERYHSSNDKKSRAALRKELIRRGVMPFEPMRIQN